MGFFEGRQLVFDNVELIVMSKVRPSGGLYKLSILIHDEQYIVLMTEREWMNFKNLLPRGRLR